MKRSVTDDEIGLIRAMLARDMKNRDIQFYFNRQDRPVNSGRITGIRQGNYGAGIPAASDATLDAFLSSFKAGPIQGQAGLSTPLTDDERVANLFSNKNGNDWRLVSGETDEVECKREVDVRKLAPVVRAIAGMANNKGGMILLGVEDKSGKVVGLANDDFSKLDLVKLTLAVKAHLQPTPSFRKGVVEVGGLQVGYVCVEPASDKPVVVHRPGDRLDDGAILFRYPAESAPIKFGDLRSLLDARDARRLGALVDVTRKIADIGVDNSAILNVADGALDVAGRPMQIDQALIDQISFIKEGQFDEVIGAPTLKLMGEITTAGGEKLPGGRRLITDDDVLRNFLDQESVLEPFEYIRFAVAGTNRDWLPIFYFAYQAKLSRSEMAGLLEGVATTKTKAKTKMIDRALGKQSALAKHTGTPAKLLAAILSGSHQPPADAKAAGNIALALQGVPTAGAPPKEDMLALLTTCLKILVEAGQIAAVSSVYRAASRLDEVYFAPT
ncbi:ATP-binding protein [Brevundimonas sp. 3P9-tot-E]|uniref:AlbA family DNA-binding domain-containing protein n=2 Tax=Caulobacteraceae TaxID=76892 RepID=UPI0034D5C199